MTLAVASPTRRAVERSPTIWGLTPRQVHDRFWASFGVQVVRLQEPTELVEHAELFLLCEPQVLATFRLTAVLDALNWLEPELMLLRVRDTRERAYREVAVSDAGGRFEGFRRLYGDSASGLTRVALTTDPELARRWQGAQDARDAWRLLRRNVDRVQRVSMGVAGHIYDGSDDGEVMECLEALIALWKRPDTTIRRAARVSREVWADEDAAVSDATRFLGPVWVGAGRSMTDDACVVGPAVLWDDPGSRPRVEHLKWLEIEPTPPKTREAPVLRARPKLRAGKRAFDIVFSLAVLALTLPIYPIVVLLIWLEDGGPFFFSHRRETLGGESFGCLKFRSMRKDAEDIKAKLEGENQADGPQFFIKDDPRLTRVGRFIRKTQIDELPQFVNVLRGEMSVVGPRPSPREENQYCPAWREARLSVRPGVTGLWQVCRTRQAGLDFQEWIRFDLEYVEKADWKMDFWIIWRTLAVVLPEKATE